LVPSSSVGGRAATRHKLARTLLLLLLLVAAMLTLLQLVPVKETPRSSSSSISLLAMRTGYSLDSSAPLCDSQETTTTVGESPPSTVGTPCSPTDLTAAETQYWIVVATCLGAFGLFFLIGFRLWV
jgi:hypothetical protein